MERGAGSALTSPDAAAGTIEELLAPPKSPTAFFTGQNLLTIGGVHAVGCRNPIG